MLHHISLNAKDPSHVAETLASMLSAVTFKAPHPPFPRNAWFVCLGDDHGSLLEVLPWGEVRDPNGRGGIARDTDMRPYAGWHALLSTRRSLDHVIGTATGAGWPVDKVNAGLFQFVQVWIENTTLIEVMSSSQAASYVAAFNADGLKSLESKLRAMETSKN